MRFQELSYGDSLVIGDVTITLEHKSGSKARLSIESDTDRYVVFVPKNRLKQSAEKSIFQPIASSEQIG